MGTLVTLKHDAWTKLASSGAGAVLSTSAKRAVCHSVGENGYPVALTQLASDPAHPFTAGQMVVTLANEIVRGGHVREVGFTPGYEHDLFVDPNHMPAHTIHSGGLYTADSRTPLEWLIQVYTQLSPQKFFIQINAYHPDGAELDADERTDATLTIDYNTDDNTTTDIALANGTSSPAGDNGGVEMRWELSETQHDNLTPTNAMGARIHRKLGLTIAVASSVTPITFSAYSETHDDAEDAEYLLRNGQTIGVQAPSSGDWYARATRPADHGESKIYVGD